jgi:hypothetical protein
MEGWWDHALEALEALLGLVPLGPAEFDDGSLVARECGVVEPGVSRPTVDDGIEVVRLAVRPTEPAVGRGQEVCGGGDRHFAVQVDVAEVPRDRAELNSHISILEVREVVGAAGPEATDGVLARFEAGGFRARATARGGNPDGTLNLVHYAAWLVKGMGRGD